MSGLTHQTPYLVEEICESGLQIGYYSRLTIELRQVFLAMKLFKVKKNLILIFKKLKTLYYRLYTVDSRVS